MSNNESCRAHAGTNFDTRLNKSRGSVQSCNEVVQGYSFIIFVLSTMHCSGDRQATGKSCALAVADN